MSISNKRKRGYEYGDIVKLRVLPLSMDGFGYTNTMQRLATLRREFIITLIGDVYIYIKCYDANDRSHYTFTVLHEWITFKDGSVPYEKKNKYSKRY